MDFALATLDIKSAYLQAGMTPREIFVRPPKGWASTWRVVWKLFKQAYGIVESGRLWQLAIEKWMTEKGIPEVPGLPQLFVKRNKSDLPILLIAKVFDDLLTVGTKEEVAKFHQDIQARFKVGRFLDRGNLVFNGMTITQKDGGAISMSMEEYLSKIPSLDIPRSRRKQQESYCTMDEVNTFLGLTGALNFVGHGILPQAAFVASHLQQSVARLAVTHWCTANKCLHELKYLSATMLFDVPISSSDPTYLAFSDARQEKPSYGQTGYVSGTFLPNNGDGIYHVIDWLSSKQSHVSFSAIGADILAAATSANRGSMMAESIEAVFHVSPTLPFALSVDSHGLCSTITTLHEGSDYRLRSTVARLRDSFENGEISTMQWIPCVANLADALTKRDVLIFKKLNEVMFTSRLGAEIL